MHCFIGESSLRSQPFYHRDTLNKPCIAYVLSGYPKKAMDNTLDRAGYGVLVSEIDKEEFGEERGETTLQIDTARASRYNKNSLIYKTFPLHKDNGEVMPMLAP